MTEIHLLLARGPFNSITNKKWKRESKYGIKVFIQFDLFIDSHQSIVEMRLFFYVLVI